MFDRYIGPIVILKSSAVLVGVLVSAVMYRNMLQSRSFNGQNNDGIYRLNVYRIKDPTYFRDTHNKLHYFGFVFHNEIELHLQLLHGISYISPDIKILKVFTTFFSLL